MSLLIREERADDIDSIRTLTQTAFKGRPYSQGTEHLIVDALREREALTLSLVAEQNSNIVGHIAFSPISVDSLFHHWYGLGPISVIPALQLQGIGSALMHEGLNRMKGMQDVRGIVVLGNPAYYQKFGFKRHSDLLFPSAPAEHFLVQSFTEEILKGTVSFHDAFNIGP
jgi:putative acetyltransferase